MIQLTHGGDWAGYRAQYGHDALDFSANVSPLGLPQGVANAIAAALPHADRYPERSGGRRSMSPKRWEKYRNEGGQG